MRADHELLELAAQAAGYELFWGITDPMIKCAEPEHPGKTHNLWNPLADDGDALRLAVRLHITPITGDAKCSAQWWVRPGLVDLDSVVEITNGDTLAAIRRAIVRAAAEIAVAQER